MAARALMKEGNLPVRDVAKRMGVSVATLYRHVGKRGAGDDAADAVARAWLTARSGRRARRWSTCAGAWRCCRRAIRPAPR